MSPMDADWFRAKMKEAGVTSSDVAEVAGRARTGISHILNGDQRMSMPWVKAFSETLGIAAEEIMHKAGLLDATFATTSPKQLTSRRPAAGFIEPSIPFTSADAVAIDQRSSNQDDIAGIAEVFGGNRAGVDVWEVQGLSMTLMGYMTGDRMVVDSHEASSARAGDVVIAQIYDDRGEATTVLRRYEPPVLVSASPLEEHRQVHVVDGNRVVIKGKVVASWRS